MQLHWCNTDGVSDFFNEQLDIFINGVDWYSWPDIASAFNGQDIKACDRENQAIDACYKKVTFLFMQINFDSKNNKSTDINV